MQRRRRVGIRRIPGLGPQILPRPELRSSLCADPSFQRGLAGERSGLRRAAAPTPDRWAPVLAMGGAEGAVAGGVAFGPLLVAAAFASDADDRGRVAGCRRVSPTVRDSSSCIEEGYADQLPRRVTPLMQTSAGPLMPFTTAVQMVSSTYMAQLSMFFADGRRASANVPLLL